MATRALLHTDFAVVRPYVVATSNTVRRGYPVKPSTSYIVEATAIADNALGIAIDNEADDWSGGAAAAGETVGVAMLGTNAIVWVLTGTATIGAVGDPVCVDNVNTNGCRTATVGGGTNKCVVLGQALEAGAAGDLTAVNLACASFTVGS